MQRHTAVRTDLQMSWIHQEYSLRPLCFSALDIVWFLRQNSPEAKLAWF